MLQDSFGSAERSSEKPINIVFCKAYTVILQRGGLIEFTVTPNYLYTVSRLCGNSYDFASVASISVNLKCYKTAEGYEDTLHSFIHSVTWNCVHFYATTKARTRSPREYIAI